eukprot:m.8857 g.8857  ORF g.8857 m.8857 type:complete len:444 (+) comp3964_c0_seq1:121-1452(+)
MPRGYLKNVAGVSRKKRRGGGGKSTRSGRMTQKKLNEKEGWIRIPTKVPTKVKYKIFSNDLECTAVINTDNITVCGDIIKLENHPKNKSDENNIIYNNKLEMGQDEEYTCTHSKGVTWLGRLRRLQQHNNATIMRMEHEAARADKARVIIVKECDICLEEIDEENLIAVAGCGHRACVNCLRTYYGNIVQLLEHYPLQCFHYACKKRASNALRTHEILHTQQQWKQYWRLKVLAYARDHPDKHVVDCDCGNPILASRRSIWFTRSTCRDNTCTARVLITPIVSNPGVRRMREIPCPHCRAIVKARNAKHQWSWVKAKCQSCTCDFEIPPSLPHMKVMNCSYCRNYMLRPVTIKTKTKVQCRHCLKSATLIPPRDKMYKTLAALQRFDGRDQFGGNGGWGECPHCHILISKGDGCNSVRCICKKYIDWRVVQGTINQTAVLLEN